MYFSTASLSTLLLTYLSTSTALPASHSKRQCQYDGLINGFSITTPFIVGSDFTLKTMRGCDILLSGDHDETLSFEILASDNTNVLESWGPYEIDYTSADPYDLTYTEAVPEGVEAGQIYEVIFYLVYYLGAASEPVTTATLSTFVPAQSAVESTSTVTVTGIPGSQ